VGELFLGSCIEAEDQVSLNTLSGSFSARIEDLYKKVNTGDAALCSHQGYCANEAELSRTGYCA